MKLTTLQDYVAQAKKRYEDDQAEWRERNGGHYSSIPFEDEQLVFAICDYHSMKGELTEEDYQFLDEAYDFTKHDINSLLDIEEEEDI